MAGNYRYWCGECDYRTPWLSESNGAGQQEEHYARRHPGIVPGGQVESERKKREGGGCLLVVAALFLVLLLASTCAHKPGNASMPPSPERVMMGTRVAW
jgi:hypothetical protein